MSAPMRVAVVGGGLAGVTAAWQLAQHDRAYGGLDVTLFEASARLGGPIETVHRDGFTIECGADGWVSEKPWARELARELGLEAKLIGSNDAGRVTYIVQGGRPVPMPDGMRMMVPMDLTALEGSSLFSDEARAAYESEIACANELKRSAPTSDESVAEFVRRHFGDEVLSKVAAPLLSGVFGGDVAKLSVQAVMPAFVRMEREHGSLIVALRAVAAVRKDQPGASIFTSLTRGTQALIDRMEAELPTDWVQLKTAVTGLAKTKGRWVVQACGGQEEFDALMLAVPAHLARELLRPVSARMAKLHEMEATSAVIAAFAFNEKVTLPRGFGFLVPAGEDNRLLAGTFVDHKYAERVPENGTLVRTFFGGEQAPKIMAWSESDISGLAFSELTKIVGSLPAPAFSIVRRWPQSLPQYGVGHLERMAEIEKLRRAETNLWLLGNTYRGVGLPDLIRDAREAARELLGLCDVADLQVASRA